MARPLRIEYPGALYHLTARGNRQEAIYTDDKDRDNFLEILSKTVHRYNLICHAYCLMGNHYHLLVETPEANLSSSMRQLNGLYTQYLNRRHHKTGHVFQGRFKSILVEKDAHLLSLCRYIVLNPVRAKMVEHPEKWKWSSYRPTATGQHVPDFLSVNWILSQFANKQAKARLLYMKFVEAGFEIQCSPWSNLISQTLLGSESFVETMQGYLKSNSKNTEIPKLQRYAGRPSLTKLLPKAIQTDKAKRNKAMAAAHIDYGYTLKEIADQLEIHYTTVSKAISIHDKK